MIKKITLNRLRLFLIGFISISFLGSIPLLVGPGLTDPEPIGKYLNGVFPATPATQNPYQVAFDNLTFDSPLNFTMVPNQNKIVVGQRDGKVYWFNNDQNTTNKNLLIDLSAEVGLVWDGGFLGLAIHPEFGTSGNKYFYVYYSTEDSNSQDFPNYFSGMSCNSAGNWGNFLVLERLEVNPVSLTPVPGTRETLIKRRMYGGTHRGGGLQFGDDGFLYLATGDNSIYKTSQDIVNNLNGGVLRIDVDKDPGRSHPPVRTMPDDVGFSDEISGIEYWIPNDNPFLSPGGSNFEEYYTLGQRNPHRMTKDMTTGIFYLGDIGGNKHEEINIVSKGKNYGWPVFEGYGSGVDGCTTMYNNMPNEEPLVEFPRSQANAIIGGYVYRGTEIPELYGEYICADYGNGEEMWSVDIQTGDYTLLGNFLPSDVISFGQDDLGEIYILKLGNNVPLYKLSTPEISYSGIPQNLSQTGAFTDLGSLNVVDGLIPYDMIDPFWSDGAQKKRWMAIPNDGSHNAADERITFSENGVWEFPVGTVLVKHFDLPINDSNPNITRKIETRFSIKDQNGEFYFLTYNWNQAQTDATLQEVSFVEPIAITTTTGGTRYQNWYFPSNSDCIACHNAVSKGTLGPRTRYLNKDYTYDKTNITANQLVTLSYLGILDQTINDSDTPGYLTHKSMYDANASIDDKARSYLDLNCAYCHRPGTGNRAEFDLRLFNTLEETGLLTANTITPIGIEGETILVPGDASKSILYHRINSLDPSIMMPPLAKGVIDDDAVLLIEEWINQLGGATNESPVAVIGATPLSGEAPLEVTFTGSNSTDDTGVVSYAWDFGDGSVSTTADPIHTFTTAGDFVVQLTVTDGEGLSDSTTVTISVSAPNQPPVAVIGATPLSGEAPLDVTFTGSNSTDDTGVVSYAWDFGDGSVSTLADPVHTFTTAGDFVVQLTVTDGDGLTDTTTVTISVSAPNQAPVAVIGATPLSGEAPLDVTFTGSNSTDDTGVVSYAWDFGDGAVSTTADPVHSFTTAGDFIVQLTVTDGDGLTDTTTVTISVSAPNQPPVAVISATPISGVAPLEVTFTGSNSTDDTGVVSYAWDFGDGAVSTTADPVHTFTTAGIFGVQLTVTDGEGLTDSTTFTISVAATNGPPVAVIGATPISGVAPLEVTFTGSNSTDDTGVVSYAWDFGDGAVSTTADPIHSFTTAGDFVVQLTVTDGDGLTDTANVTISVSAPNQPPVAVIGATPLSGEAPLEVTFTGSNSTDDTGVVSYAWDFGDGAVSSTADPVHTFTTAGIFGVQLTVTDGEGLTDSTTFTISVAAPNGPPLAVIGASPTSGVSPLVVNFTGSNSTDDSGVVSYAWDFGDGAVSTSANPVHTFTAAGNFVVQLTVTDGDGLTDTANVTISVSEPNQPPVAVISATPISGVAPLEVTFTGSNSTDDTGVVSYAWDFGDGSVSTLADPIKSFTTAGDFVVQLTVTDGDGLTDTANVTISVSAPNQPPVAVIGATPLSGEAPLDVTFTGSNSTDDTGVVSYAWDFGDGAVSTTADPVHSFTTAGDFIVQLTVTDGDGLTDTTTVTISVSAPNQPPVAMIGATPISGVAPLEVTFTGSNSTDDTGVVSYTWDFGDGAVSTAADPVHTFATAGDFVVQLTVTDGEGLSHSTTVTISVSESNQPPVAVIVATPISGVVPLEVTFTGSNSTDDTGVVSYAWDFGDGAVSTAADPVHTFATAGDFVVQLTVTDGDGLTDTTTVTISVSAPNQPPVAVISATPISGVAPLEVTFTGSNSTDDTGVVSYAWDFGDGSDSSTTDPTHTFTTAGEFVVQLTVADEDGLSDTTTVTISVSEANQPPVAWIGATPISGVVPLQVTFAGSNSTDETGVVSYTWDFGDGSVSSAANPVHTFTTAGDFNVELTVADGDGLTDTTSMTIRVFEFKGKMKVILMENPPPLGMSHIKILNQPPDVTVNRIYFHDATGRLINSFNPHNIATDIGYEIPVYGLEDGVYFVTLVMNRQAPVMLKIVVRN